MYNLNYGNDGDFSTCDKLLDTVNRVTRYTNFMIADIIVWKKNSALPNNVSANKLTRIWEFVFVFCRKDESKTFKSNKQIKSVSKTGQKYYTNMYNFIEAPNNDGSCNLNKATYSSDLVLQLLNMYCGDKSAVVYDPFMGTGTTAVACVKYGVNYIGSELSENQCEYANNRVKELIEKELKGDN